MFLTAFIIGRPGSGKSTTANLIRMLANDYGWLCHTINDYEHLKMMCLREEEENIDLDKRDFIQRELDGWMGFDVKNFEVLNTVLKGIKKEVEDVKDKNPEDNITICIVEFARANYQDALELFDYKILDEAHLLYLNVDLERCVERNRKRTDHFISDEIMDTYYRYDDWARESDNLRHGYVKHEIENIGTFEDLRRKIYKWFVSQLEYKISIPKVLINLR